MRYPIFDCDLIFLLFISELLNQHFGREDDHTHLATLGGGHTALGGRLFQYERLAATTRGRLGKEEPKDWSGIHMR